MRKYNTQKISTNATFSMQFILNIYFTFASVILFAKKLPKMNLIINFVKFLKDEKFRFKRYESAGNELCRDAAN